MQLLELEQSINIFWLVNSAICCVVLLGCDHQAMSYIVFQCVFHWFRWIIDLYRWTVISSHRDVGNHPHSWPYFRYLQICSCLWIRVLQINSARLITVYSANICKERDMQICMYTHIYIYIYCYYYYII